VSREETEGACGIIIQPQTLGDYQFFGHGKKKKKNLGVPWKGGKTKKRQRKLSAFKGDPTKVIEVKETIWGGRSQKG